MNNTHGGQDPYNRPMMEKWDESSRLFHCIRQLADLRRTNRALAYGSHQQKYLSDATYAFTRCYRNSRVFTLLNQGDATTITVANVDLPDGVHRCVLSGTDVRVENGTIHNLPLAAKGAVVLSVIAPPVEGTTIVKFQINNFFTRPGERIAVTGDVPELGCWDLRKSAALEYINGDTWFNEIPFEDSVGQPICFKFVVLKEGAEDPAWEARYENVLHRRFLLPASGRVKLEFDWESF